MWSWIVIGALYVLVFGGFRILGGMSSAMDALRDLRVLQSLWDSGEAPWAVWARR